MSVERPESDVTIAIGLVGLLSLTAAVGISRAFGLNDGAAIFLVYFGTAIPMIAWSLVAEKSYLRPSTGLDFAIQRPWPETVEIAKVKFLGLAATLALIFLFYSTARFYEDEKYEFYLFAFQIAAVLSLLVAPFYIAQTTRYMAEPRDDLWHFGALVCLKREAVDWSKVADHLRAWGIKAFFLAFLVHALPTFVIMTVNFDLSRIAESPGEIFALIILVMLLCDVCFGTIGYVFTFRVLDTHIRRANPYLSAWVVVLICYPPFILFDQGGLLDYRHGTQDWDVWLAGSDVALLVCGTLVVGLTALYSWATVIFGLRFANLTNRGIITNGPYRYFKHPAYLSKNVSWWLMYLPFLSVLGPEEALRNSILLLFVNLIYYLRAKTEEKHLMADPKYRAYSAWIAEHGLLPRLARKIGRRPQGVAGGSA